MPESSWITDLEGFKDAVRNDEYAELELPTGDLLVTDWDGDGIYHPYIFSSHVEIETDNDYVSNVEHNEESLDSMVESVEKATKTRVKTIEYDVNSNLFHVYQNKEDLLDES